MGAEVLVRSRAGRPVQHVEIPRGGRELQDARASEVEGIAGIEAAESRVHGDGGYFELLQRGREPWALAAMPPIAT